MATIKCKGLTGVEFDLTVTMGSTTMNGLTALAQAVEGQEIVTAMYAGIIAQKDKTINQTNDGAKTLTAAGLVDGDRVYISYARTHSRCRSSNSIFVYMLCCLPIIKKIYKIRVNNGNNYM